MTIPTYELRRRSISTLGGELVETIELFGQRNCPHCGVSGEVTSRPPHALGPDLHRNEASSVRPARYWEFTCSSCQGSWDARIVEKVEVTSL